MSRIAAHLTHLSRALLLAVTTAAAANAQDCPGLPPLEPPKLETCGTGWRDRVAGAVGLGCAGRNDRATAEFERQSRGFTTGLAYDTDHYWRTSLDDSSRAVTTDQLRGCRGENINIEIVPGNVTYFEYQLHSPSDVLVASGEFTNWSGDRILGPNVTLPESGTYTLRTRTTARPSTKEVSDRRGTRHVTTYPRKFHVGFRSDINREALQVGDQVEATASGAQPFIRRVVVKGGSKARFRVASQGTGDFSYVILRESGEELARSPQPTAYVEVPAVSPTSDETFRVEVRPARADASIGVQFSVLDDKASGAEIAVGSRLQSAFKLPSQFDSETNAAHRTVYATETVRLTYRAAGAERLTLTVRPSGAAGLKMRVRVYDEATEEVLLDAPVAQTASLPLALPRGGAWVISLSPVSATEMIQAGEARYTVELAAGAAPGR